MSSSARLMVANDPTTGQVGIETQNTDARGAQLPYDHGLHATHRSCAVGTQLPAAIVKTRTKLRMRRDSTSGNSQR